MLHIIIRFLQQVVLQLLVQKENSQYKITIKVNHQKYVSNWQIKYKLQSESTWHEANDLSFYVTSAGTYQIKVGFGDRS